MRVLLSCGGKMSSSQLAEYIEDAAKKRNIDDIKVDATSIDAIEDDIKNANYDLVLLAPQVSYRADYIRKEYLDSKNIPLKLIKGNLYNPIHANELLDDIIKFKEKGE
ncbi:MAG: PTS fructose transporter subunit IIA [Lactobacillus sp.]|nr:PTS fructose transporter subunit IIA [Lactobacillus sp.]